MGAVESEIDCTNEIAKRLSRELPPGAIFAAIDAVRHENEVLDFRVFYLTEEYGEKHSLKISYEIEDLLRKLARLSSTREKGLYKKLRFTMERDGGAIRYNVKYDYEDTTPGFIGSNGVLIDAAFCDRPGRD